MPNGPGAGRADHGKPVTIDCFSGRSIEAKRSLHTEMVERLERRSIARDSGPVP